MSIKVSVIVPTLNSGETLEKCLASLVANKSKYDFEIIVVDAGSTDNTLEIARRFTPNILSGEPRRINRNKGVEHAHGDIVCFTDSDCVVPSNWIDGLVDGLLRLNARDRRIIGVGGGNVPVTENASFTELLIARTIRSPLVSFKARNVELYVREQPVLHNPPINSAYFTAPFREAGGFAEEYTVGEDVELDARLTTRGYRLYYLPDVTVRHKHRSSFRKFVRQMYAFGANRIRVGRRYRNYLRVHHYGPLLLCLMTFTPFIVVPLAMGLINALWVALREKSAVLFLPLIGLTMSFYVSYGAGEIAQLLRRERV